MSTMMLFPHFGTWYIAQALELCKMEPTEKQLDMYTIKKERKNVTCFVKEFLKNDGVFVIRMVGMHTGILFTSELTSELYRIHSDLLLNNSEQRFSEDTTLKLVEDGTPTKIPSIKNKQKRRADSAPLQEEKELKTKLLPIENENNKQSSSSSNSSSSKENQNESDNDNQKGN
ncbi:hypothetical protein ACQ4LE_004885 [Meloidogyne hapla]|uniref:DUF1794 domain-containing protein n=1 Tax=Meloidogyne hapla TaxID=6305 RepID=A0A1I8BUL6_MELHA